MEIEEKIYRTMKHSGALSLAVGIVSLIIGLAAGILMIVSGARLLGERRKILF